VREFLDEFSLRGDGRSRAEAIADRPEPCGDARYDAYLGTLAEHLAVAHGLERPGWSLEAARFLDRFWFQRGARVPGRLDRPGAGRLPAPRRVRARALPAPRLSDVVGGAPTALAYDERRATRDIDAVFEPRGGLRGCRSGR